jgi:alanyl-tRNA synthetase
MNSKDVREKYLKSFENKGHKIIPSASLVPENDPTTLFTGSGMQPLITYLLGEKHPMGTKLTDSQKCFRSMDIDEVGNNRHTTFFEMLGNWSLGEYFKAEQLPWFFEFLTKIVGLDPKKLYVTVFAGDKSLDIPKDDESIEIWKRLFKESGVDYKDVCIGSEADGYEKGMQGARIFAYDAEKNWWSRSGTPSNMPVGEPGGPDSEVFYDFDLPHDTKFGKECHLNCDCGRFLEIGNSVFMEYIKNAAGSFSKLPQRNVDFGGGLERITAASNGDPDVFKIDTLYQIIAGIEAALGDNASDASYGDALYTKSYRIVADHLRAAIFIMADGVIPSSNERGYVVRRLLRRAILHIDKLGKGDGVLEAGIVNVIDAYKDSYPDLNEKRESILKEALAEEEKFRKTLFRGLKEFEKAEWMGIPDESYPQNDKTAAISGHAAQVLPADIAFNLFQTYGFPIELTEELAKEKGIIINRKEFNLKMQEHQNLSRSGSEQKFKGGLADTKEETIRLHTAHHLLLATLQQVLGPYVKQRGSNITSERLRIDFSHPQKVTSEELKKVGELVNEKIKEHLNMTRREMPREEAERIGAEMEFGVKYGETVSVYFLEDNKGNIFSKEFCGGPHVSNTSELGYFKILKEEAVSAGIRRIKAVLE